jgi:hypothetical protein
MISLFPARESLVRDIPAGDGKIDNLFYSVEQGRQAQVGKRQTTDKCQ